MDKDPFASEYSGELAPKSNLARLVDSLEIYNRRFSFEETVRTAVFEKEEGQAVQREADRLLEYENLKSTMFPIANSLGLSFLPVKINTGISLISNKGLEGSYTPTAMNVNLENGSKFVDYLSSLDLNTITDCESKALKYVGNNILSQIKDYDLNNPNNDAFFQLIGSIAKISEEYNRLGLFDIGISFGKYVSFSRGGVLKEYLLAERFYLDKPYSTEPAFKQDFALKWHCTDGSPEYVQKKWEDVIKTLLVISENPKTADLYNRAVGTAKQAIEEAITDEQTQRKTSIHDFKNEGKDKILQRWIEVRKPYVQVLTSISSRLSEF